MMRPLSLILDTNIWMDLYFPNRSHHVASYQMVLAAQEKEAELYYSPHSIIDLFYLANSEQKNLLRNDGGELTESFALGANEIAWGCIQNIYEIGAPVPITAPILSKALRMKSVHSDFEDDVLLAATQLANLDFLVTNDQKLLTKGIVPSLSAEDMLAYLQTL